MSQNGAAPWIPCGALHVSPPSALCASMSVDSAYSASWATQDDHVTYVPPQKGEAGLVSVTIHSLSWKICVGASSCPSPSATTTGRRHVIPPSREIETTRSPSLARPSLLIRKF